jgi:hypothetical protein
MLVAKPTSRPFTLSFEGAPISKSVPVSGLCVRSLPGLGRGVGVHPERLGMFNSPNVDALDAASSISPLSATLTKNTRGYILQPKCLLVLAAPIGPFTRHPSVFDFQLLALFTLSLEGPALSAVEVSRTEGSTFNSPPPNLSYFNFKLSTFNHFSPKSLKIRTYAKQPPNPCRIRTSKTQHLKPFRIRTYEKNRGEGPSWLISYPMKDFSPERPPGVRDPSDRPTKDSYPERTFASGRRRGCRRGLQAGLAWSARGGSSRGWR